MAVVPGVAARKQIGPALNFSNVTVEGRNQTLFTF